MTFTVEKKLHTIKVLLVMGLLTRLIRALRFSKGQTHDFEMFKVAKLEIHDSVKSAVDLGFIGIQNHHKNIEIPNKATKLKKLTDSQKAENKRYASKRVAIEHTNRSCKIFKICGSRYRGKHKNYEETWKIVTALVNLKIMTRHLKFQTI